MKARGGTAVMAARASVIDALDYFPTPPWASRALVNDVLPQLGVAFHTAGMTLWEPAAGGGHMVEALRPYFLEVFASDVYDYGYGYAVGSFIGQGPDVARCPFRPDLIVTNPPFNKALEFAERALETARVGVALLVRSAWAEGSERYRTLFKDRPPSMIAQFVERVAMVKGRWDPEASTATSYAWFIWRKADRSGRCAYFWIPDGAKARHSSANDVELFGGRVFWSEKSPISLHRSVL
jgi:hypothetical protein